MHFFNFLFVLILVMLTKSICLATEATGGSLPEVPVGGDWSDWLGWVLAIIALVLVEIVLRFVKTEKNISLIRLIASVLDSIAGIFAKNKKTGGGVHKL
jgi:formate-dependent nitrite reductase membrane component NrfD